MKKISHRTESFYLGAKSGISTLISAKGLYKRKLAHKLLGVISCKGDRPASRHALVSYVTHPFLITQEEFDHAPHTNPRECLEIVDALLRLGYDVDVINWTNTSFIPKKPYDLVLDVNQNLERLSSFLKKDCAKIFYITGAHWLFQNHAEYERLNALKERRHAVLIPRRIMSPNRNIEYADYAIALGNNFAKNTYTYAGKKIAPLSLLSIVSFPSPEQKDFEAYQKHFVWIGGGGAVHKGLDLVLECFAKLPDFHLTVCGPVHAEHDFYALYRKELEETPNIHAVGRIDVRGAQFAEIIRQATGLIYPSASEGQSGSVITGMHAGLIPIASYESGVDVRPFGIQLERSSIEEIEKAIRYLAGLPAAELRERAVKTWTYAREQHTPERFRKILHGFLSDITKHHRQ